MTVAKFSVSLDSHVAERVEQAAREDRVSFSKWLSTAAEHQLRLREGLRGVAEYEAEAGPFTEEERAEGRAVLNRLLGRS
ncbi:MAG: hypothetical protein LBK95_09020 [Bifidobacteriaceae bacterium]|nr:hypothetical protein [Bifidobacteriaceae bacterium]